MAAANQREWRHEVTTYRAGDRFTYSDWPTPNHLPEGHPPDCIWKHVETQWDYEENCYLYIFAVVHRRDL